MCGIAGFSFQDKFLIQRMLKRITHRGPDENGIFYDNFCTLGISRLAIIDLEKGSQPYYSEDNSITVVFNGEIYNYKELRNELEDEGYKFFSSHSDGEVIPNLFLKYGIDFIHKLNGMFAIALYDKLNRKLYIIRDRIGKKPLYYTIIKNNIFFGSEIKVFKCIDTKFELDYNSLVNYLQLKNTSTPNSMYKKIKQVNPGSYLIYDLEKRIFDKKKYWEIDFSKKINIPENKIIEKIDNLLKDSVKIRLNSDVEFGSYLSGGLDSSLITYLIVKLTGKKVKTFSLGYKDNFKNKDYDIYFARKMAEYLGTEHYEYLLDAKEVFDNIESVIKAIDEPFSGTISTYFLTKLISKYVKVAISGDGADELFGSYLTHRLSNPIEYFTYIQKRDYNLLTMNDKENLKPFDSIEQFKFLIEIYDKDIILWRNKLNVFTDDEIKELLGKNFTIINPYEKFRIKLTGKTVLDKCLEIDQLELLPNQILVFVDRLSMAHSVEVRNPYLDYRFVELIASIDSNLKIKKGINKYILKQVAKKYLPQDIINRPKEGFVLPVFKWIEDKYFQFVKERILNSKMIRTFDMNVKFIESLLKKFKRNKKEHAKIWNLFILAIWSDINEIN